MRKSVPHVDNPDLSEVAVPQDEPNSTSDAPAAAANDATVHIPVEDLTVLSDAVQESILLRARLANEAAAAQDTWSRSSEKLKGESDQDHQARIKREFEAAVLAVRRQEAAPPPPPQVVPPAIAAQTLKEMEAGRRQSEYWKEQAKLRPMPTAKEIQAAGTNTPVFRPGEFMHEKGDSEGKNKATTSLPSR
jgi:hypothetical protein